jgi:hypothetical protein
MTWWKIVYWNLWIQALVFAGRYDSTVVTTLVVLGAMLSTIRVEERADGHRKANSSSHGNPADGAGAAVSGAGVSAGPGEGARALPSSGLETGEIIAWRHWYWFEEGGEFLTSVRKNADGHRPIWPPGEPMTGEPGDHDTIGVHAWKTKRAALEYLRLARLGVVGRVALWGEVVEHETGYRAQYAKVVSLDYADLWTRNQGKDKPRTKDDECRARDQKSLRQLRELYGVAEFKLTTVKDDR